MRKTIFSNSPDITLDFANATEIFCSDHMPVIRDIRMSINGSPPKYFKNTYHELLTEAGIEYNDKIFIFNHYLWFPDVVNAVFTGECFIGNSTVFSRLNWDQVPEFEVTKHCSFMSNKARPHRALCAMVLANLYKTNIGYSYNQLPNNDIVIQELLAGTSYNLNLHATLPDTWYEFNPADTKLEFGGYKTGAFNNHLNFEKVLYENIFKNSAVSLVAEPAFFERGFGITEKTYMAIYAGQFMIFVGSYAAADRLKSLGIDTFDDVIDHSYQYIEHPGQRVVEAILRNKTLLDDIPLLNQLRKENISRLNNNLRIVRDVEHVRGIVKTLNNPALMAKTNTEVWAWPSTMN